MAVVTPITKNYAGIINWGDLETEIRLEAEFTDGALTSLSGAQVCITGDTMVAATDIEYSEVDGE